MPLSNDTGAPPNTRPAPPRSRKVAITFEDLPTQPPSICSIQKERLSRQKHHWGQLNDLTHWYLKRIPALDQPIDLVVECYSSDREFENLDAYHRELREVLSFRDEPRIIGISLRKGFY